jgi:hypothetical protein
MAGFQPAPAASRPISLNTMSILCWPTSWQQRHPGTHIALIGIRTVRARAPEGMTVKHLHFG